MAFLDFLPLIGTGLSAVGSLVGNLFGSNSASNLNADSINFQREENEKNRAFAREQYAISLADSRQDYRTQLSDSRQTMQMQSDIQRKMLDYIYKNFESPQAQAAALRKIGVNPAAVLANIQSPMNLSAGSVSAVSPTARGGNTLSPTYTSPPHLVDEGQYYSAVVPQIASAIESLASAGLHSAETDKTQKTLQLTLDKMLADVNGQNLANAYQNAVNANYDAFGKDKIAAELNSLGAQAYMYLSQGDTSKAEKATFEILEKLRKQEHEFNKPKVAMAAQYWSLFMNEMQESLNLRREQVLTEHTTRVKNLAQANELNASAKNIQLENEFKDATMSGRLSMFEDEMVNSFNSTVVSNAEKSKAIAAANLANYADSNKEAIFWKDYCLSILAGFGDVIGNVTTAWSRIGNMKSFQNMSKSQQEKVKAQIRNLDASTENLEVQSGDVMTVSKPTSSGTKTVTYRNKYRVYDHKKNK